MNQRKIEYKIATDGTQSLMIYFLNKSLGILAETAFRKRYAELKEATTRSSKALKDIETESEATLADVGMMYLENVKLRDEMLAMETSTKLEYTNKFYAITLHPSEWCNVLNDIGSVSWIPAGYNTCKNAEVTEISRAGTLSIEFSSGFVFSEKSK